jgi:phage terminase large subunit
MTDVDIHTEVFNSVYLPYLEDVTPLQIFFGGSSSGKSVFAVGQRTVYDMMRGGRNYLICRQVAKTLRNSVFNEVVKIITNWGVIGLFSINKSDMVITCTRNGNQILFVGLDDVEKLKSITPTKGVITDVVIEEATEAEYRTVKQLDKRLRGGSEKTPKRMTLLFNPILQTSWIYSEYFATIAWATDQREYHDENITILKTTYLDNKFLTAQDHKKLESEKDSYYYQVYTLGNWGVLGEIIFTNWKVVDLSEMTDQFTNHRNGLDFGFSSDPAAMAIMHMDSMRKVLYIYDEFYERGLTNQALAKEITDRIGNDLLVCDSAEPKSIQELREKGVNAYGAKKGKDSVNFGIQWLQGLEIIIDAKCVNAKREFSTYHWKKDKDDNAMRIPCGKDDHLIDGVRYGLEDDMIEIAGVVPDPFSSW